MGSRVLKIIIVSISSLALLFIGRSFCLQNINFFEYFTVFLLSLLALLLLINSSDILSAYLIIEMQALCFYVLASFKRDSSFSTEAGFLTVIKTDENPVHINDLEGFPANHWADIPKAGKISGSYRAYYHPSPNFGKWVSSIKWGNSKLPKTTTK